METLTLLIASWKGIRIPESKKFLPVESRIQEIFAGVIPNTGNFCLWDLKSWPLESGMQLKIIRNPSNQSGISLN